MTERPILFSAPMVKALLAGTKTQTRRVVKPQPGDYSVAHPGSYIDSYCGERKTAENPRGMSTRWMWWRPDNKIGPDIEKPCPYGVPGDVLWVRETWAPADVMYQEHAIDPPSVVAFRADRSAIKHNGLRTWPVPAFDLASWNWDSIKWKPSIFMPRWASRLSLRVTSIRVERVQDISEADARAEGVRAQDASILIRFVDDARGHVVDEMSNTARGAYAALWDEINGAGTWHANPWVWVVGFEVMR